MNTKDTPMVPISRRMMIVPLLLIVIFTIVGFGLIDLYLDKTTLQMYEKNLTSLAQSGAQTISLLSDTAGVEEFDKLADSFAENFCFRVTIINSEGVVLGDSRLSVDQIRKVENHADRPEIQQAGNLGIGIARHHSRTLNADLMYVAARYNTVYHNGYFRVALPLAELDHERNRQRLVVGGFCFLALCIVAILSLLISRYLLSLVNKGKQYLEQTVISKNKQIEIMGNFVTQLTACNSIEEMVKVIDIVSSMLMPRVTGALALIRSSRDKVEIVGSWNGTWPGEQSYFPDQCWSLRTGKAHIADAGDGTIPCDHSADHEGRMICIPLIAHGETLGVAHFLYPKGMEWTPADHQVISTVSEHTSLSIANLQLRESLRQQAIRDPLTGLYNRRYLMESMNHELSRAIRNRQKLGVLMIDLDHFKKFNDEHGHETGDFILSEFGRLVRTIIRSGDLACRYGGEEFVILLPETDYEGISHVADKILTRVREHDFVLNSHSYGPVTLSIGTAIFPENGKTPEDLLKISDEALYEAKKTGRDRVVHALMPAM